MNLPAPVPRRPAVVQTGKVKLKLRYVSYLANSSSYCQGLLASLQFCSRAVSVKFLPLNSGLDSYSNQRRPTGMVVAWPPTEPSSRALSHKSVQ